MRMKVFSFFSCFLPLNYVVLQSIVPSRLQQLYPKFVMAQTDAPRKETNANFLFSFFGKKATLNDNFRCSILKTGAKNKFFYLKMGFLSKTRTTYEVSFSKGPTQFYLGHVRFAKCCF